MKSGDKVKFKTIFENMEINQNKDIALAFQLGMAYGIGIVNNDKDQIIKDLKKLIKESILDKINSYINHIKNSGMGKKKSLEYIKKFINGLQVNKSMEEEMNINLKPCPFCGSKNVRAYYVDETGTEYAYEGETEVNPFIKCHGCDSEWFSDCYEAEDVLKAWNRRYDADSN